MHAALRSPAFALSLLAARRCAARPRRSSAASRPTAASAAPKSRCSSPAPGLADAQEILFYEPGITVTHLEAAGANAVKTKLTIAPDCRLGLAPAARPHGQRASASCARSASARCRRSRRSSRTTTSPQPQTIALDTTVNGVADNEDVDYFAVEAKKGRADHGRGRRHAAGQHVLRSLRRDPGREAVRAGPLATTRRWSGRTASARSSPRRTARTSSRSAKRRSPATASCLYRLHVGRFPRPTAVLPSGGKPGETLDVHWLGDVLASEAEKITLPADGSSSVRRVRPRRPRHLAHRPMPFRLSDLTNVLEVEPNNGLAEGHRRSPRRSP